MSLVKNLLNLVYNSTHVQTILDELEISSALGIMSPPSTTNTSSVTHCLCNNQFCSVLNWSKLKSWIGKSYYFWVKQNMKKKKYDFVLNPSKYILQAAIHNSKLTKGIELYLSFFSSYATQFAQKPSKSLMRKKWTCITCNCS